MRRSLFYNPQLLFCRIAERLTERERLRSLKNTCADQLTLDHIDSLELIRIAACGGARTVYDIGANIGTWTQLVKAIMPTSCVIAFEPLEEHCKQFESNTKRLENVQLVSVALGDMTENRSFYPASFSDASSFLKLSDAGKKQFHLENLAPLTLTTRRLDDVIAEQSLPSPDLIKLDVQGFELQVLKGATQSIINCTWIICEVSFKKIYESQCLFSDIVNFLSPFGFELQAFGSRTRLGAELVQTDVLFAKVN